MGVISRIGAVVTSALLLGGVLNAAPPVRAHEQEDSCPAFAILAARGAGQRGELEPHRYSPQSRWVSNGFEGENFKRLLELMESRHQQSTGQSLLRNIPVLALNREQYPAEDPMPLLGDVEKQSDVNSQARVVVETMSSRSLSRQVMDAGYRLNEGVNRAVLSAPRLIENWEKETGCQPKYLLMGFSQGALVFDELEKQLLSKQQLAGAFYMGNPQMIAGHGQIIGQTGGRGLLSFRPRDPRLGDYTLNYCLAGDIACDSTPANLGAAAQTLAKVHGEYFLEDYSASDAAVADVLISWLQR